MKTMETPSSPEAVFSAKIISLLNQVPSLSEQPELNTIISSNIREGVIIRLPQTTTAPRKRQRLLEEILRKEMVKQGVRLTEEEITTIANRISPHPDSPPALSENTLWFTMTDAFKKTTSLAQRPEVAEMLAKKVTKKLLEESPFLVQAKTYRQILAQTVTEELKTPLLPQEIDQVAQETQPLGAALTSTQLTAAPSPQKMAAVIEGEILRFKPKTVEPKMAEALAKTAVAAIEAEIPYVSFSLEQYQEIVSQVVAESTARFKILLTPETVSQISAQTLAEARKILEPGVDINKEKFETLINKQLAAIYQDKAPALVETVSYHVSLEIGQQLPAKISAKAYSRLVRKVFIRELRQAEIKIPSAKTFQELVKQVSEQSFPLALSIRRESEGVAFKPLFTTLHPPTLVSFSKRTLVSPIIKPLQWLVANNENVPPALKMAVLEGLNSQQLEKTIAFLQESGLFPQHPKILALGQLKDQLQLFEEKHPILNFLLRHFHEYSQKIGLRQEWGVKPVWSGKSGYVWNLRQRLNQLGGFLKTHSWKVMPQEKKVIQFVLADKLVRFFTFGKVSSYKDLKSLIFNKTFRPVLTRLGKTALGQTVKAGVKKAGTWLAAKLGLSATLAAIPEPVVSKILLALQLTWTGLKALVKKIKQKPGLMIAIGLTSIALPILLPMLPLIGAAMTGFGILTAGLGILSKAGTFLSAISSTTGAFLSGAAHTLSGVLSGLTSISLPASLPLIGVGGGIGVVAATTVFTLMTTSTAFVQPSTPFRYTKQLPPTAIKPECESLVTRIEEAAQKYCVPTAILMAISRMEASGVWGWRCEEIERYSTDNWWQNATEEEKNRGYCYDTCARTGLCTGTTVMGPMQFEEKTWQGFMHGYSPMDRCRLDLSLEAAAKKIKANSLSGANCGPWDEKTIRLVAFKYCGSCGTEGCKQSPPNPNETLCSPACGYDYCGGVWTLYQQYENP
jgi:hypothetical protein